MISHLVQVERGTGKVRRRETDVRPLCHATNSVPESQPNPTDPTNPVVLTLIQFSAFGQDFYPLCDVPMTSSKTS